MLNKAVISKIKNESEPDKIEARDLKVYQTSSRIFSKETNSHFIPDLAVHKNNELYLYEILLEDSMDPEKWQLMSIHSKNHKGYLYLVVPDYLKRKSKERTSEKAA